MHPINDPMIVSAKNKIKIAMKVLGTFGEFIVAF